MPTIRGNFFRNNQPLVRLSVSNDVPQANGEDFGPAAVKRVAVKALVDTGATTTVVDRALVSELSLQSLGAKPVLFPNMETTQFHPSCFCSFFFSATTKQESPVYEWPEIVEALAFNLAGREFKVVLGMDIISKGKLTLFEKTVDFSF
ncbi:hypothetical protein [Aquisalinus flavus]|uniref:Peptidase A2 domain-containing protein n=1 Tax=Aquisalinus flavus TaxID=1526572 RepID=A0A8J2V770_9PROT|nr:hypothetical protein [Aquisalinus flavus]MBD0425545.1 hypothetical protein [Aquisalinus flavus]UNE48828.1 hypothetical protein FF099_12600 [Aquisalinus flavus]GGD15224.1 hypothetical protein GCM10011342_24980 [Aquisalinus flavus]